MPTYQYRALNQARDELRGEITADSPDQALTRIRDQGLFPTSLREKRARPSRPPTEAEDPDDRPVRGGLFGRLPQKQLVYFTRQLSTMQDAGLTILRSVQILMEQQRPGLLRRTLSEMLEDLQRGATLAEAMGRHPRVFDELYVKMVAAGEAGGVLETILRRLGDSLERNFQMRRRAIQSAFYPTLVLVFGTIIFTVILGVVVPLLADAIRESTGGRLTGPIQILDGLSQWFFRGPVPGWAVVFLTPVAAWVLARVSKRTRAGRYAWDALRMKIPLVGHIVRKMAVVRFSRVMGMLIEAGVPIVEAIGISREVSGNAVFSQRLSGIQESVRAGEPFTASMRSTGMFDLTVLNMVEVGEETGELDKMLLKVAEIYEEDVDVLLRSLTTLLGPVMMIGIGIVAGLIIVGIVLSIVSAIMSQM